MPVGHSQPAAEVHKLVSHLITIANGQLLPGFGVPKKRWNRFHHKRSRSPGRGALDLPTTSLHSNTFEVLTDDNYDADEPEDRAEEDPQDSGWSPKPPFPFASTTENKGEGDDEDDDEDTGLPVEPPLTSSEINWDHIPKRIVLQKSSDYSTVVEWRESYVWQVTRIPVSLEAQSERILDKRRSYIYHHREWCRLLLNMKKLAPEIINGIIRACTANLIKYPLNGDCWTIPVRFEAEDEDVATISTYNAYHGTPTKRWVQAYKKLPAAFWLSPQVAFECRKHFCLPPLFMSEVHETGYIDVDIPHEPKMWLGQGMGELTSVIIDMTHRRRDPLLLRVRPRLTGGCTVLAFFEERRFSRVHYTSISRQRQVFYCLAWWRKNSKRRSGDVVEHGSHNIIPWNMGNSRDDVMVDESRTRIASCIMIDVTVEEPGSWPKSSLSFEKINRLDLLDASMAKCGSFPHMEFAGFTSVAQKPRD
ncbi:hypothetical protein K461DRAFT_307928 [Myriangium duriaei CBS 260.36]|uniref:Uncharacterized protein n=1 Tax=Myriangium duriaei CBS 260.36 TaxID=1168546 RepID=A0A9P4IYJ8_9PEZI|nr:hypothetical protein K461DRAFT_307928 [Myriangium duriaei CBS 260.36]